MLKAENFEGMRRKTSKGIVVCSCIWFGYTRNLRRMTKKSQMKFFKKKVKSEIFGSLCCRKLCLRCPELNQTISLRVTYKNILMSAEVEI